MEMKLYYIAEVNEERTSNNTFVEDAVMIDGPFASYEQAERSILNFKYNKTGVIVCQTVNVELSFY